MDADMAARSSTCNGMDNGMARHQSGKDKPMFRDRKEAGERLAMQLAH
jgi:hypothetical protein